MDGRPNDLDCRFGQFSQKQVCLEVCEWSGKETCRLRVRIGHRSDIVVGWLYRRTQGFQGVVAQARRSQAANVEQKFRSIR
jgi:hypothetical protein